jgi:hypothetical protein
MLLNAGFVGWQGYSSVSAIATHHGKNWTEIRLVFRLI